MDKTSNGLNAAAAYDLACRYGNLFQYNPAAAAACAAAYGNMFSANSVVSKQPVSGTTTFPSIKKNSNNNTNSVSSPTNSSVSSSSSNANNSSSSSLNNIPTGLKNINELASTKSIKIDEEEKGEEDEGANKEDIANKTFESVSSDSLKSDVEDDLLDEEQSSLTKHLKVLNAKTDKKKSRSATHSRSSSISSMNSAASSTGSSFIIKGDENCNNETDNEEDEELSHEISDENQEININNNTDTDVIQDELVSGTKKAIENCFDSDEAPVDGDEYEDDLDRGPRKKFCTNNLEDKGDASAGNSQQQTSLGSILDSLTARCSPTPSSMSSTDRQTAKLAKKVDNLKTKLSAEQLNSFKEELVSSVNFAIQATFKKYFGSQIEQQDQAKVALKTEATPRVEKFSSQIQQQNKRPLAPPSHNFNMSNLLNNNHHKKTGVRVGDINKRKLSTSSPYKPYQQEIAKQQVKYHQALIETKPRINTQQIGSTPSHSSSSSASSSSNHQNKQHSMVNQFYSAALSHLHNSKNASSNFNMNALVNNSNHNSINTHQTNTSPFPATPSQYHPSLLTPNQPPANMSSIFAHNQHQQFLMSAAAAAAAQSSQANPHHNGPNASYFNNMASRLFTPYLLEHHTGPPQSQPLISTPNTSSKTVQRSSNSYQSSTPNIFSHMPSKRRRTKVTDTRLSPRNTSSVSVRSNNLLQMSGGNSLSGINGQGSGNNRNESNDIDDQENYNQDFDDNSHKFMGSNQDESETGTNNMQVNDEDSMSDYNDQNGGGQLATMPNGCFSSNIFLKNDSQSGTSDVQQQINRDTNLSMDMGMSSTNEYNGYQIATLSSLHLRKAKLMFFFSRYPSSTILRNYFPDVKFNKANTAQLVKWFSNFREFFYIQMEKYARQHQAEGIQHADELHVDMDSEIFRALNSHYNRNNQLEIPPSFCYVIEATLKEFFNSIQEGKDLDPSWKKAIYKVIARMDDTIPEFFKSIKWMETLESSI